MVRAISCGRLERLSWTWTTLESALTYGALEAALNSHLCGGQLFLLIVEELFIFGGPVQRRRRSLAAADDGGDLVEVARADLALVLPPGEALFSGGEVLLLQLDERAHVVARVAVGELEHGVVEGVEAREGDELELVAHRAEIALEFRDGGVVEVALPVERRRAVVGE